MIKLLSKRERIILYATIGVLIFFLGFNFLIAPLVTKVANLNKEIKLAREKLKEYRWLLSQRDYIQGAYAKSSSVFKASGEKENPLVSALSSLENLATQADIRIIDIRPQASRGSTPYRQMLIDLRTEGAMEGYLSFFYNLENSLSLLRIKKFQLTAKPNTPALEGSFTIYE